MLGKPLIAYTIEKAKQSKYLDRLIISTDDPKIADVARSYGAEVPFPQACRLREKASPGGKPGARFAKRAAVKMEDGGPAIFRQERLGLNGRPFTIYKIRSMRMIVVPLSI